MTLSSAAMQLVMMAGAVVVVDEKCGCVGIFFLKLIVVWECLGAKVHPTVDRLAISSFGCLTFICH